MGYCISSLALGWCSGRLLLYPQYGHGIATGAFLKAGPLSLCLSALAHVMIDVPVSSHAAYSKNSATRQGSLSRAASGHRDFWGIVFSFCQHGGCRTPQGGGYMQPTRRQTQRRFILDACRRPSMCPIQAGQEQETSGVTVPRSVSSAPASASARDDVQLTAKFARKTATAFLIHSMAAPALRAICHRAPRFARLNGSEIKPPAFEPQPVWLAARHGLCRISHFPAVCAGNAYHAPTPVRLVIGHPARRRAEALLETALRGGSSHTVADALSPIRRLPVHQPAEEMEIAATPHVPSLHGLLLAHCYPAPWQPEFIRLD